MKRMRNRMLVDSQRRLVMTEEKKGKEVDIEEMGGRGNRDEGREAMGRKAGKQKEE